LKPTDIRRSFCLAIGVIFVCGSSFFFVSSIGISFHNFKNRVEKFVVDIMVDLAFEI
jgi:hypothetical protein